jgi:hypothetical protein
VGLVLAWPGLGQTDAEVRGLLAELTEDVIVAEWDATSDDHGRTALLASVREARDALTTGGSNPDELVLVGFGLGGVAAAGLAHYAKRLGIELGRIIAVSGTWDAPDPFSGDLIEQIPERVELVSESYLLATTLRRT